VDEFGHLEVSPAKTVWLAPPLAVRVVGAALLFLHEKYVRWEVPNHC
jgi:hypothetical protein